LIWDLAIDISQTTTDHQTGDAMPKLSLPSSAIQQAQDLILVNTALKLFTSEDFSSFRNETQDAPPGWIATMVSSLSVYKGPQIDAIDAKEIADEVSGRYCLPNISVVLMPGQAPTIVGRLHGFYLPSRNTIHLFTPTMRVLVHELAHAITAHKYNTLGHGPLHLQVWKDLEFHYQLFPKEFPHLPRELPYDHNHTL
jgi:hypothetical protein